MRFKTLSWVVLVPPVLVALVCLAGCPAPSHGPPPPAVAVPPGSPGVPQAAPHEGRPYDVVPSQSLLTILAFRGGALAKAGHNHVIASHDVSGTFYVPDDVLRTSFELHVPVAQLTIDEPALRSREGPDFPAEVPDAAKEGTRRNMLSEALLNAGQYPELILTSERMQPGTMGPASLQADVRISVRGQIHTLPVAVAYTLSADDLVASGELPIKQSDLGLTPFSAMLGALQVQDELRIRFRIVAHAGAIRSAAQSWE